MAINISLVHGLEVAGQASQVLSAAWDSPSLLYTPGYLRWQLSFPSPAEMPCVGAFENRELIGFAGATPRRFRCGSAEFEAAVVSFVAVRPEWRGQGIAAGLYRVLLKRLRELETPVFTYAVKGSTGEKALLRAYADAGFTIRSTGIYSSYGWAYRPTDPEGGWRAYFSEDSSLIQSLIERVSPDSGVVLWSAPDASKRSHYLGDPRSRKLIIAEQVDRGLVGAGFLVHSELNTNHGLQRVPTLDSLWMPMPDTGGLLALLRLAWTTWPASSPLSSMVMCPNLAGFEEASLQRARIRRTGTQFNGYFCTSGQHTGLAPERTNLEVV